MSAMFLVPDDTNHALSTTAALCVGVALGVADAVAEADGFGEAVCVSLDTETDCPLFEAGLLPPASELKKMMATITTAETIHWVVFFSGSPASG